MKIRRKKTKHFVLYLRKDKTAELIPAKIDRENEFLINAGNISFVRDEGWIFKTPMRKLNNKVLFIAVQGSGKVLNQDQVEKLVSDDIKDMDLCKENESVIKKAFDTSSLAALFDTLRIPIYLAFMIFVLGFLFGLVIDWAYLYKKLFGVIR